MMIDDTELNTFVGAGVALGVAAIGAIGARREIRRHRRKRGRDVDVVEREAVEQYAADPGRFVRDVLRSNDQLTKRVEAAEKKADAAEKKSDDVERAFAAFRDKDRRFRNALARWFVDIMAVFESHDIEMPYPRDGDQDLLSDVIPSALEATQPRPPRPKPSTP